jgi:penicillin-binding protein 1C
VVKDLGKTNLIEQLKMADFHTVKKQEKDLGLSIVIGAYGITLEEMTQLYAVFANDGNWQKTEMLDDKLTERKVRNTSIISPSATYLITEILAQIKRPDLPNNFDYTYRLPKIAWKTGTSFGRRDAWSIGYNKKYTVGVWVGNFSGEGVPELSGAEIATPLLFQLFNTLDYNASNEWFRQPKDVVSRQVCAESGDLPSEYCTNKILDYSIKNISHTRKCTHLKKLNVNLTELMSYCMQCLPVYGYKEKLCSNNAPELLSFYELKHVLYEKIPLHNPNCTRFFKTDNNAPMITNPNHGSEYFLSEK